jgi:hypothetical protein
MDQAISSFVLGGGISSAIVSFVALNRRYLDWRGPDWRRLGTHRSSKARQSTLPAADLRSLDEVEREAEALMRAHP